MIWRAASRSALAVAVMQVTSGLATAFGLFVTTGVLVELLAFGPAADRVVAALAFVAGSWACAFGGLPG